MHSAPVEAIATDPENRFMVTGGRDKVARVWSLPTSSCCRCCSADLHGEEGRIDALAVSPDGNLVAVGGYFCSYEKTHCIFIFERASGRIVKRVSEFPRHVRRLAWSADGTVVAAGMGGKAGIRLLRTADWSELGRDADYDAYVSALSLGSGGQLATASWDGKIRVYGYDANGLALKRAKAASDLTHTIYRTRRTAAARRR